MRGSPGLTLLAAALGVMMVALDGTIVAVANPAIQTKLGASLGTVVNHYNFSQKELKKEDKDILRITDSAPGLAMDALTLEKPELEP